MHKIKTDLFQTKSQIFYKNNTLKFYEKRRPHEIVLNLCLSNQNFPLKTQCEHGSGMVMKEHALSKTVQVQMVIFHAIKLPPLTQ